MLSTNNCCSNSQELGSGTQSGWGSAEWGLIPRADMAFLCDSWQVTKSPWASFPVCKVTPLGPAAS